MPERHRHLHWAQLRVYGHLLCQQRGLEQVEDLILAVDVVAHRENIDACVDEFLVTFHCQSRAPRGVFGVANDQPDSPASDQPGHDLADDLSAGCPDDVADEEDFQSHVVCVDLDWKLAKSKYLK